MMENVLLMRNFCSALSKFPATLHFYYLNHRFKYSLMWDETNCIFAMETLEYSYIKTSCLELR